MKAPPDSALADAQGIIADLRRQLAERTAERDEALEQQAGDDQVGQARDHDPADRARGAPPDPAVEQVRERYKPRRLRPISSRKQKTSAATRGEATTSQTLYSVTPVSLRISCCQYCPSPKDATTRTAALMKKTGQDRRRGCRGFRSAKARQIHAASTPSP